MEYLFYKFSITLHYTTFNNEITINTDRRLDYLKRRGVFVFY
jgi:hypothetical protein